MSKLNKFLDKYRNLGSVKAKVGIIESKTYPDGESVANVGYYNEYGTDVIPSRPFFRKSIADSREEVPRVVVAALKAGVDPESAIRLGGELVMNHLKDNVMTWADPPNAQSTIDQKGFNAPLRGQDRLLRNSFSVEVSDD